MLPSSLVRPGHIVAQPTFAYYREAGRCLAAKGAGASVGERPAPDAGPVRSRTSVTTAPIQT